MKKLTTLIAACLMASACASVSEAPARSDRDNAGDGKSVCNDKCAVLWPPLTATSGSASGDWTIITRNDGSKQWAYNGKPLYYWVKDQKPGDRTGDGFNKVWQLARP